MGKIDLSVIILSFNTRDLTKSCVEALLKSLRLNRISYEIIIVDNASDDGSEKMLNELRRRDKKIKILFNKRNLGFSKANNLVLKNVQGKFILYLNSDVIIARVDFKKLLEFLDGKQEAAGLTVKVMLKNGYIDPASHRGFPTVWNSFCYISGLEKITKNIPVLNKLFGGYHLTHLNTNQIHEIDSPSGAFFLVKRSIVDEVGGFDEDFFFYGEDIDLAFRIKKKGYRIFYYPGYNALHLKYSSGLGKKDIMTRNKTKDYFYEAMKIFYRKHYDKVNSPVLNNIIYKTIDFMKKSHG